MYDIERRMLTGVINTSVEGMTDEEARELLKINFEDVYNTKEVQESFEITGFLAPFVSVIRKSDNKKGMMTFTHLPRFYFGFEEDDK